MLNSEMKKEKKLQFIVLELRQSRQVALFPESIDFVNFSLLFFLIFVCLFVVFFYQRGKFYKDKVAKNQVRLLL